MTKNFVEVGHVVSWDNSTSGEPKIRHTASRFYLPPGTKIYILSDTLDPSVATDTAQATPTVSPQDRESAPAIFSVPSP